MYESTEPAHSPIAIAIAIAQVRMKSGWGAGQRSADGKKCATAESFTTTLDLWGRERT